MKYFYLIAILNLLTSCATMDESLKLGGSLGALSGAAATYAAYSSTGKNPSFDTVTTGAGAGLLLGLIASYYTHKKVEENRLGFEENQFEMHFGDLPPSPFVVPSINSKKGVR